MGVTLPSNVELAQRLKEYGEDGNDRAFADVCHGLWPGLLSRALKVLGDFGEAEEAAQEALFCLARAARSGRWKADGRSVTAYALAICARKARRRQERFLRRTLPGPLCEELRSPGPGPEEKAIGKELSQKVRAWWERLGPRDQGILRTWLQDGMTLSEQSQRLGIPLATLGRLRQKLAGDLRRLINEHRSTQDTGGTEG